MESALHDSFVAPRETPPDVLPASLYLQERLQERRARNVRPKRLRQSDFGPRRGRDDDIFLAEAEASRAASSRAFESSPLVAPTRHGAEAGDSSRKRGLGAKRLDEHMDRLTKENFALKLELDHRRDHTAKLQDTIEAMRAQVERAEHLQEEHAELLRINGQLVEELEKRDKAVEEAMDIICDLEDRVADMEERRSTVTRPSTANADSGYAGTETHEHAPPSSPPELTKAPKTPQITQDQTPTAASAAANRLLGAVNSKTPARPRREPTFLTQKKESTQVLRNVYLETTQSLHPVKSFNSLLTKQESRNGDNEANSPRLSVLSESSFPSLYSPKKGISPDNYAWEADEDPSNASAHGPSPHLRQDSIKRVSQWMDERNLIEDTPSKSNAITSPLSDQLDAESSTSPCKSVYRSLGNGKLVIDPSKENEMTMDDVQYIKPYPLITARGGSNSPIPTSFGGAMFGEPLLPPTPVSATSRMLRGSRSSIVDERSLLDTTPAALKGFNVLDPGIRTAPQQMRSSVELNQAYQSYMNHREDLSIGKDNGEDDADSDIARDLSMEYDGFPDGGSILMGTPSRFLKHGKPSLAPFDGYDLSPPRSGHPSCARRQSSSGFTTVPQKPHLNRAETSPPAQHSFNRLVTTNLQQPSYNSITSPRSYHSGSSSNRTIMQPEERARTISPELFRTDSNSAAPGGSRASPPRSRTSPSPARRLSQRAHGLLRRMSNSQRDVPTLTTTEREKAPLPTLTTAPSSSYVNIVPKEARRPGTSYSGGGGGAELTSLPLYPGPPPSQKGMHAISTTRPSISARTNTAPSSAIPTRPRTSSISEQMAVVKEAPALPGSADRRSLFRRNSNARKGPGEAHMPLQGQLPLPPFRISDGSAGTAAGMRGMMTRRRGSVKDAVVNSASAAVRRPWR